MTDPKAFDLIIFVNSNKKNRKDFKILRFFKSPLFLGVVLTWIFAGLAFDFYRLKHQNENDRRTHAFFNLLETLDLKYSDFRFRFRGPKKSQTTDPQVALITIDDRSIEELGRWPWTRSLTAEVLENAMKLNPKAIGLDVIFSEPEKDAGGAADDILAKTIEKYKDKIVLGVFNDDHGDNFKAFQDYCRNEAFQRANANTFVKLNPTFFVDDTTDLFVDFNFDSIFKNIFDHLEKENTKAFFDQRTAEPRAANQDKLERQKKQLTFFLQESNMDYCSVWLTESDRYLNSFRNSYLELFQTSPDLKGLEFNDAVKKFKSMVKTLPVNQKRKWTINLPQFHQAADFSGSFNAEQDSDGTIRKMSLFYRTGNRIGLSYVPSLALQTYLVSQGFQARIEIQKDPENVEQKIISGFQIIDATKDPEVTVGSLPIDQQGRLKINYFGGSNHFYFLPARELLNGKKTAEVTSGFYDPVTHKQMLKTEEVDKSFFLKDRTLIVGATAIAVYDLRVTPFEKNFPGPEIHLNVLANLLDQDFLKNYAHEKFWMITFLIIFGLVLSAAISIKGAAFGFALTAASLASLVGFDLYLFFRGIEVVILLPILMTLGLYVFLTFYKYLVEERKKKHLRSTFSKYVSPAIVDEILKDPANVELGGQKKRVSVFFSDVRGFTTLSEKLDPRVLSDVLNIYLTPMTEIVFRNKGTLDKYIGDAVMAFFGAPISFANHAYCACQCALESLEKLAEIQIALKNFGDIHIDIGIGINTAEVSVGNMGSDIVRNYTVMGDGVNLAARLEGINKEYGTRIVISQFTYEEVKTFFLCRTLDLVQVKGKKEPVKIYELIQNRKSPKFNPEIEKKAQSFDSALTKYFEKDFKSAHLQFKVLAADPADKTSAQYVERCEAFILNPPPANWDGIFVMKTK